MTLPGSRTVGRIAWFCFAALTVTLACQVSLPGQTRATPTTGPLAATTPASVAPAATATTPAGTPRVKVAPGTIMLDQTTAISKGSKVEMSFDGQAGQVVGIDVNLVSGKPVYEFHLADKFGNFVANFASDPDNTTETIAEFTLPYNGTYKAVLIGSSGDGSVEVAITAGDKPSGGGKIDGPGKSLSAMISAARSYHTYLLALTQGQVITVAAKSNSGGAPDTSLTLYGPDGQYVTDADDVSAPDNLDAVVPGFVVPTTGTYVAIVTGKGNTFGAYTFSANPDTVPPEAQGQPSVVFDTDYPLGLFEGSNAELSFDATLGDALKIQVTGLSAELSADIYLYSPFGQTIAYAVSTDKGKDVALNEVQAPYSGRYKVQIRPTGNGQGTLRIVHLAGTDLTGGGAFGDKPTESLPGRVVATNVFHYYQFKANAGDRISLAAFSVSKTGKLDLGFALLGPNGRQLMFADDSDSDNPKDPELNNYVILQNGTYTVIVYSFVPATGSYDIVLTRNP